MHRSRQRLTSLTAAVAILATALLSVAPSALGDDWARERAAAREVEQLDPAIRTAITARSAAPVAPSTATATPAPAPNDAFAWGAAAVGLAVGVAGMCLAFGCVTLVRHDGRLRSA